VLSWQHGRDHRLKPEPACRHRHPEVQARTAPNPPRAADVRGDRSRRADAATPVDQIAAESWQRRTLALAVVAGLLLRRPSRPTVAAALALGACAALAVRRQLGRCELAIVTVAAAVMSTLAVAMR
jgi:hypothetical protein